MTAVMVKYAVKTNEMIKEQISAVMFKVPEIFTAVVDKVDKLEKENANIKVQLHNLSENFESHQIRALPALTKPKSEFKRQIF